jgi:mannose-1-phosphate guanylyltransferase
MELYAVIMAGGIGARFWPRSKAKEPKQLMKIVGDNTMIQDTVNRLKGLIKTDRIYVITNKIQKDKVCKQLPQIPANNIIAEPFGKNTAACIGLASAIVKKQCEDAVMITLPADHFIKDVKEFQSNVKSAVKFAYDSKGLVTIGINPNRPETGYGYIQIDENKLEGEIYKVLTFAEKPNHSTATRFIESGDFMWNSGMFIWRVDSILREIKKYLPDLYSGTQVLYESFGKKGFTNVLKKVYGELKSISIDYGVMEKSKNVYLVKGYFDWNDVGSWSSVFELSEKDNNNNSKVGTVYLEDAYSSYIYSPDKFTAVIGANNLIVINTKDALLICDRKNAQDVKHIVDHLKMNNMKHLL